MDLRKWCEEQGLTINNYELIERAFIHSSYVNESKQPIEDNERLEFIGDAVLQLLTAKFLYSQQDPVLDEGKMTLLRAQLVREEALAHFGRELGLNQFLVLGAGETKSGGVERDSNIADTFEAFIGALYLDGHMENVQNIFDKTIGNEFSNLDPFDSMDYKTKLQEFMQSDVRKTVVYEVVAMEGPSNQPTFKSIVKLDDIVLGSGIGQSKKKSQQAAAKQALEKLVK